MSPRPHQHQPADQSAATARELLDAYFDGELGNEDRRRLSEAMAGDPVLRAEFSRTAEAMDLLAQDGRDRPGPDLTERVLLASAGRRHYLSGGQRRAVLAGRSAVAVAALLMVASLAVWYRLTPASFRLPPAERPLGLLVDRSADEAGRLGAAPPTLRQGLAEAVGEPTRHRVVVFNLPADGPGAFTARVGDGATPALGDGLASTSQMHRAPVMPGGGDAPVLALQSAGSWWPAGYGSGHAGGQGLRAPTLARVVDSPSLLLAPSRQSGRQAVGRRDVLGVVSALSDGPGWDAWAQPLFEPAVGHAEHGSWIRASSRTSGAGPHSGSR